MIACCSNALISNFCAKLDKNMSEVVQILTEVYGADAKKELGVVWHKRFKRAGCPKTCWTDENVEIGSF